MPLREICWLDGRLVPLAEARIDPRDRGWLYGDALYEVVKVRSGAPLLVDEHFERLRHGLSRVEIPEPPGLERALGRVLAASGLEDGSLYIQVSRGAGPRSNLPPPDLPPTGLVMPQAHAHPGEERREVGHRVVSHPEVRWAHLDLKTTSLLGGVLGKLAARRDGANEVVFVRRDGEIAEGGSANFFVVRDGRLVTHPLDGRILPGVTRRVVLDLAAEAGLEVVERPPRIGERGEWREAFLTGTLATVRGVTVFDDEPVADGRVGPVTRRLVDAYEAFERSAAGG